MKPLIETPLGRALREHRESCTSAPRCTMERSCPEYLAIVERATAQRKIYEGPRHAHTWLSIREAESV